MSWQKCALCNGTGVDPTGSLFSTARPICPVCNGQKIISELNGLPPGFPTVQGTEKDEKAIIRFTIQKRLADPQITIDEIIEQLKQEKA